MSAAVQTSSVKHWIWPTMTFDSSYWRLSLVILAVRFLKKPIMYERSSLKPSSILDLQFGQPFVDRYLAVVISNNWVRTGHDIWLFRWLLYRCLRSTFELSPCLIRRVASIIKEFIFIRIGSLPAQLSRERNVCVACLRMNKYSCFAQV